MKYEAISINPAIVAWARDRAGFTIDDALQSFAGILDWESGDASPSYPQLEQMADKFKVPIAVFFFPEPPDLPPVSESFRTLSEADFNKLPRQVRLLVRKAKAMQLSIAELTDGRRPSERNVLSDISFDLESSVSSIAIQLRNYLGISINDQKNWPNVETALENWRDSLQRVGVFVFKDAFRVQGYSGFCLYDDLYPIIYVNNSTTKTRQIFTLFHEMAHLLFQTSGIDGLRDEFIARLPNDSRKIEVICNQFAAELLLPEDVFNQVFSGKDPTESTAEELASQFHVSREFIFRKFLDRGLISKAVYEEAADRWARSKRAGSGGDYYNNVITYLGREYIDLAFKQYYQNRIDDNQLADFLNIKPKNVSTLEQYVLR